MELEAIRRTNITISQRQLLGNLKMEQAETLPPMVGFLARIDLQFRQIGGRTVKGL
jgi:hypothetical protein